MVELDASLILPQVRSTDVVALDDVLKGLTRPDEKQGRIVELRFFGGLPTEEIAEVLGILPSRSSATGMWQRRGCRER